MGVDGSHVLLMDVRIVRSSLVHAVLVLYSETEALLTVRRFLMQPRTLMRSIFRRRSLFESRGLAVQGCAVRSGGTDATVVDG
jgi:hypothetical protein